MGEALRFGQTVVVLVEKRVAVPGQIGGRFSRPGGGIEIGGNSFALLGSTEGPSVVVLAHDDIAGREVGQHRCSGERSESAGR